MHWFDRQYDESLIAAYIDRFPFCEDPGVLFFEATPDYLFEPQCAPRIHYWMPDVKSIILIRNPVERAWSLWYNCFMRYFGTTLDQIRVLPLEVDYDTPEAMKNPVDPTSHYRILQEGIYIKHIKRWHEYFPAENCLIIKSEDMFKDPETILDHIFKFLGLKIGVTLEKYTPFDPFKPPQFKNPRIPDDIMEPYTEFFKPYNAMLYEYLNRDFGWPI